MLWLSWWLLLDCCVVLYVMYGWVVNCCVMMFGGNVLICSVCWLMIIVVCWLKVFIVCVLIIVMWWLYVVGFVNVI